MTTPALKIRHHVKRIIANHIWPVTLILGIVAMPISAAADKPKEPLNVLLITLDDMGYATTGADGCEVPGITPHIDSLASEGILFTHGYVMNPMCGPSRAALLTGRYPHLNGMMGHGSQPPEFWQEPFVKTPALSTYLHDFGYRTGALLKYSRSDFLNTWDVTYDELPYGVGFHDRNPESFYQRTKAFIADSQKRGQPFFLYANPIDPHDPWPDTKFEKDSLAKWNPHRPYPEPSRRYTSEEVDVPECLVDTPDIRKNLIPYYESMHRGDECIGGILKALNESDQADNTLVIFLSDNGMGVPAAKNTLYQHGTRTPVIMKLPGKIKPGTVDAKSIVSSLDLMPTIIEACQLPPIDGIEGRSIYDVVTGKKAQTDRPYAFASFDYWGDSTEEQFFPQRSIINKDFCYIWNSFAQRDDEKVVPMYWNNIVESSLSDSPKMANRIEFMKNRPVEEFYDLSKDPGCWNNLVDDANYQDKLNHFKALLKQEMTTTNDPESVHFEH